MIEFTLYPQGKPHALTFSYDDGRKEDAQLINLFNRYGVKGTFHLNGKNYLNMSQEEKAAVRAMYEGHEISCHTLNHGMPDEMPTAALIQEIMQDRMILEEISGYPVVGMSYPFGSFNRKTAEVMANCGIVYSRTTAATGNFRLPEDFLLWHPSCHHRNGLEMAKSFLSTMNVLYRSQTLYIWGHSYEFQTEEDWAYIEEILKLLSNNDQIWYATNMEIYNYRTAQKQLRVSADETVFYNPTAIDVWIKKDWKQVIHVPAGQTVRI